MTDAPERIWRVKPWVPSQHECGLASWPNKDHAGEGATEYRRADLPPKVKPLEWVDLHADGSLYETSNDHPLGYHASINSRGVDGFWYFELHPTLDAAKAAAQADYERRILSALDGYRPDDWPQKGSE